MVTRKRLNSPRSLSLTISLNLNLKPNLKPKSNHPPLHPPLTPAQKLTRADDLMSDLLDSCLWPCNSSGQSKRTIKFTSAYRRPRNLNMLDIKQIIHSVQSRKLKNISEATALIRQLPAVVSYMANAEPPRLGKHIGLYLQLFLPKCGIRFCETDRYDQRRLPSPSLAPSHRASSETIPENALDPVPQRPTKRRKRQSNIKSRELRDLLSSSDLSRCSSSSSISATAEESYLGPNSRIHLAVFATRDYAPNDIIVGCEGSFADLTEQEDLKLRSAAHLPLRAPHLSDDTDFSHLVNSRGKFQVFCGPARFVNHDCANNVELLREGFTIKFKVTRPIKTGEEVLTSYGTNYFGERNCECMCGTCERTGKGFYASQKTVKREAEDTRPVGVTATANGPENETELSSLGDSSELSRASHSPLSSHVNTPPTSRQPHPASRSSSTRRQARALDGPPPTLDTFTSAVKFLPTADLRLPLGLPSQDPSVCAPTPLPASPAAADAQLPVKRKTYWITTKQKQLGLVPWESDPAYAYAPTTPSLLGPSKRQSTADPSPAPPPPPPPAPSEAPSNPRRIPMRSYWISTKQKQLGIVPWDPNSIPQGPLPSSESAPKRSTRAARKAQQGAETYLGAIPPASRGRRLSYRASDDGIQKAGLLLASKAGRELLGIRPRRDGMREQKNGTEELLVGQREGSSIADGEEVKKSEGSSSSSSWTTMTHDKEDKVEGVALKEEDINMLEEGLSSSCPSVEGHSDHKTEPKQGLCQAGQEWSVSAGVSSEWASSSQHGQSSKVVSEASGRLMEVVDNSSRRVLVPSIG